MKKFFVLMLLALVLVVGVAGVFVHFYLMQDYVVFVESFDNGLLTVDTKAHYINRTYKDGKWSLTTDGRLTLESGFSFGNDGAPWSWT